MLDGGPQTSHTFGTAARKREQWRPMHTCTTAATPAPSGFVPVFQRVRGWWSWHIFAFQASRFHHRWLFANLPHAMFASAAVSSVFAPETRPRPVHIHSSGGNVRTVIFSANHAAQECDAHTVGRPLRTSFRPHVRSGTAAFRITGRFT
ncbi:hypothetical protein BAUCODRAFT_436921 [Baudoinia panamericana UAMH 10762]|uniref:Uncharacterized protein n=1 Tax=Baudoinia panamericana (strain UAMH 10762) TaxID=717646 RepID=M2LRI7_BAUPA|nr:uncharacterized protein BAUCODRAFT_436921 [Baudoinia panamericana UAMH 10762]EMC97057.1 hypothetical protein BAUCODRAFT_436921 [Baudoinia panamericana UAMH 10762]